MASLEAAVETLTLALDDLEAQLSEQKRVHREESKGLNGDLDTLRERAGEAQRLTRDAAINLDQSIRDLKAILDLAAPTTTDQ